VRELYRWLGVDKVFFRENGEKISPEVENVLRSFAESGFVDYGIIPGPMHPQQAWWFNRCSRPDLAGAFSWVLYVDVDEYLVVLNECAPSWQPSFPKCLLIIPRSASNAAMAVVLSVKGRLRLNGSSVCKLQAECNQVPNSFSA
jgi:hypothetical protein